MADHIVVSQYSGDVTALAAIGSTAALIDLVLGLLLGVAGGASVVVAHFIGAGDRERVSRTSHTAILFSLLGGILIMCTSLAISEPALALMGTKPDVFDGASLYFRIICFGFPAATVYNFGASVLRAAGDSRTPLYILTVSGGINVFLNLLFVAGFGMAVSGVAIATILSQYVSAIWVVYVLIRRRDEDYAISFKKLRIDKRILARILRLGVPAGLQGSLFGISNVLLASAVNQFDTITVTAKTIEGNIDAFTYITMNAYYHTVLTFVGQNYGAMKVDRIKKSFFYGLLQVIAVGIFISRMEMLFIEPLCSLFIETGNPDYNSIMQQAKAASVFILTFYFLCGIMEVLSATARGLGYSVSPMITVLLGACGIRVAWVYLAFPLERFYTLKGLLTCYPVSWSCTCLALLLLILIAFKRLKKINGAK